MRAWLFACGTVVACGAENGAHDHSAGGRAGTSGMAAVAGASASLGGAGTSGAAGMGTAGTSAAGMGTGGMSAGGTSAGGMSAGGTSTAGMSTAGTTTGGTGTAGSGAVSAGSAGRGESGGRAGAAGLAGSSGMATGGRGGTHAAGTGGQPGAAGAAEDGGAAGASEAPPEPTGLSWPIDCIPDRTCTGIGYPDIDADGDAFDCSEPGYVGHEGTDIRISAEAEAAGVSVWAAADGVVLFAFDGKYDQCPNANEPDCQDPPSIEPNGMTGNTVCTPIGPYCGTGQPGCYWCFAGGNVIVIRHTGVPGVFATRYDHLKKGSVLVQPGDTVTRGQKLAEAASAGNSTGPHLHFEVWGTGFYELAEPWAGPCGPNHGPSLWAYDPPWSEP